MATAHSRADWVGVVETAYMPAKNDDAWASRLIETCKPVFGSSVLALHGVEHTADFSRSKAIVASGTVAPLTTLKHIDDALAGLDHASARSMYYPPRIASTLRHNIRQLPATASRSFEAYLAAYCLKDAVGLVMNPEPGVSLVLWGGRDHVARLSAHQRRLFTELALHIEAAYRLRRRPESIRAVLSSEGKLLHRRDRRDHRDDDDDEALDESSLARHVAQIERARTRQKRSQPEAIELWQALVSGTSSLVERKEEGTRRHYLVLDNALPRQPFRALSKRELDVVTYASRGLSTKLVGYALGLSAPTVSAQLATAASKLGLATRIELVRLAAMLTRDPRAGFENDVAFTTAERDVLDLLRTGLSNREIAQLRGRSIRTIANQVARLLRKTRSPSRRALIVQGRSPS